MTNFTNKVLIFLKNGMEKTMRSYDRFTNDENEEEDNFDFQKHHTACKQAIVHLESLLKLYERNMALDHEANDKKSDEGKNLQSLIDEACVRIKNDNKKT